MNLTNHFLIAMPSLQQDYFNASLTLVCEHNDEGAIGLVINRPSHISVLELLSQLSLNPSRRWLDAPVMEGGPVSQDHGFILYRGDASYGASLNVTPSLYLSSGHEVLEAIAKDEGPEQFLVALGYAGWAGGQLEAEVSRNVWLTVEAESDLIFDTPFEERLAKAAGALGIDLNLISTESGQH